MLTLAARVWMCVSYHRVQPQLAHTYTYALAHTQTHTHTAGCWADLLALALCLPPAASCIGCIVFWGHSSCCGPSPPPVHVPSRHTHTITHTLSHTHTLASFKCAGLALCKTNFFHYFCCSSLLLLVVFIYGLFLFSFFS